MPKSTESRQSGSRHNKKNTYKESGINKLFKLILIVVLIPFLVLGVLLTVANIRYFYKIRPYARKERLLLDENEVIRERNQILRNQIAYFEERVQKTKVELAELKQELQLVQTIISEKKWEYAILIQDRFFMLEEIDQLQKENTTLRFLIHDRYDELEKLDAEIKEKESQVTAIKE